MCASSVSGPRPYLPRRFRPHSGNSVFSPRHRYRHHKKPLHCSSSILCYTRESRTTSRGSGPGRSLSACQQSPASYRADRPCRMSLPERKCLYCHESRLFYRSFEPHPVQYLVSVLLGGKTRSGHHIP